MENYLRKYSQYEPIEIANLRNSLIHNYTPEGFALEHLPGYEKHHLKTSNFGKILHLTVCIHDLEQGARDYIDAMKSDTPGGMYIKAYTYYKKYLPIMPVDNSKLVFSDHAQQ